MIVTESAPLVLGSASPRRRDILSGLGIPIRVVPGQGDEAQRSGDDPHTYLSRVVRAKLEDVAVRLDAPVPGVVVADTIVVVGGCILGKPRDERDAIELLGRLVGTSHLVYTRYAIALGVAAARPVAERTVATKVTMRAASPDEIRRYAATGEGLDKAGAYAAQGIGTFLVERIDGSYSNVVGLPACEIVLDLIATGLLVSFPVTAVRS